MEKSHSELQRYHYEAVRDSLEYRMTGLMEIMREELLMAMPRVPIDVPEMGTEIPKMGTTKVINITQHIHLDKSKKRRDRL